MNDQTWGISVKRLFIEGEIFGSGEPVELTFDGPMKIDITAQNNDDWLEGLFKRDFIYEPKNRSVDIKGTAYPNSKTGTIFTMQKKEKEVKNDGMRYDRFPGNGGLPVAASVPGYNSIPWTSKKVSLIVIDGTYIGYAKTLEEKRNFAFQEGTILVCWPGAYSQDIFIVDDKDKFRRALGFKLVEEVKKTDERGRKWVV